MRTLICSYTSNMGRETVDNKMDFGRYKRNKVFAWVLGLAVALLLVVSRPVLALSPHKAFHDYAKQTWSIDQGLPQTTVLSLAQGPQGYMWIGTEAALARFDGVSFRSFVPADTPALPGAWIETLYNDGHGNLWIGTYKGLALYHGGQFTRVPAPEHTRPYVRDITTGPEGHITVATSSGLFRVHDGHLIRDSALGHTRTNALLTHDATLWVGGVDAIWQQTAGKTVKLKAPAGPDTIVNAMVNYEGTIWIATSHGLYRYDDHQWKVFSHKHGLATSLIHTLYVDSSENLWATTGMGIARIYHGHLAQFVKESNPASVKDVMAMTEDREHDLWMGSYIHGVAKFWNGHASWLSTEEGLKDKLVWSVVRAPQGGWWVGTRRGVERFEHGRFHLVIPPSALPNPEAYTLLADGPRLWIGTRSGVAVYEHDHVHIPKGLEQLANTQVSGIVKGPKGDLWFASNSGLFRLHQGHLKHYKGKDGNEPLRCRMILFTHSGKLLVGTQAGLFERSGEHLIPVTGSGVINGSDITSLSNPEQGVVIAGTLSGDQLIISDHGHWYSVTGKQGLPKSAPFFTVRDSRGWFWVAGIRGLYRVRYRTLLEVAQGTRKKLHPQYLLSERGNWRGSQKGYCCNGAGNAKGELWDHRLWLPTRGGVAVVNTRDVHFNKVPPTVLVEAVRVKGKWEQLPLKKSLQIPASVRDLAFRFTALSFQKPNGVRLWFRLKGYNRHWHELEDPSQRIVYYTNLPPGNFVFQVRAQNDVGVPSTHDAALGFVIEPHFYQTWWFRILAALMFLLLILAGYRFQLRYLRARQIQLENLVEARTNELSEANQRLEEASRTDPLTGLSNRRYLRSQLPSDLAWFRRHMETLGGDETVMVFAIIDLDHFKRINDSLGHDAGDELLCQFSRRLLDTVRAGDYCVRWGGEEFLVVLRPLLREQVAIVIHRILAAIREPFHLGHGEPVNMTCSVGVVEYPFIARDPDALDWEALVSLADRALYIVKSSGRNGWALLRPGKAFDASQTLEHVRENPDAAISRDELTIVRSKKG